MAGVARVVAATLLLAVLAATSYAIDYAQSSVIAYAAERILASQVDDDELPRELLHDGLQSVMVGRANGLHLFTLTLALLVYPYVPVAGVAIARRRAGSASTTPVALVFTITLPTFCVGVLLYRIGWMSAVLCALCWLVLLFLAFLWALVFPGPVLAPDTSPQRVRHMTITEAAPVVFLLAAALSTVQAIRAWDIRSPFTVSATLKVYAYAAMISLLLVYLSSALNAVLVRSSVAASRKKQHAD